MFLTSKSRIQQTELNGYWRLVDNELYVTSSGRVIITPRYLWTDGYSIPSLIIPIIGDKNKFDVRPAHCHDLMCRFHQIIEVDMTVNELINEGYLHEHNDLIVCEDIPLRDLSINTISKKYANNLLKEMMLSCNINKKTCEAVRIGVSFNLNWYWKTGKKSLLDYNIFKEDIGLVNGF